MAKVIMEKAYLKIIYQPSEQNNAFKFKIIMIYVLEIIKMLTRNYSVEYSIMRIKDGYQRN